MTILTSPFTFWI